MTDLYVQAQRRQQLQQFLEETRLLGMLEQHHLDALRRIREQRTTADRFALAVVDEAQRAGWTKSEMTMLTLGMGAQVREARGREERRKRDEHS